MDSWPLFNSAQPTTPTATHQNSELDQCHQDRSSQNARTQVDEHKESHHNSLAAADLAAATLTAGSHKRVVVGRLIGGVLVVLCHGNRLRVDAAEERLSHPDVPDHGRSLHHAAPMRAALRPEPAAAAPPGVVARRASAADRPARTGGAGEVARWRASMRPHR
eukprot:SAG31_NODE_7631_length_1635_cov_0.854818_2_plen_163_part_00